MTSTDVGFFSACRRGEQNGDDCLIMEPALSNPVHTNTEGFRHEVMQSAELPRRDKQPHTSGTDAPSSAAAQPRGPPRASAQLSQPDRTSRSGNLMDLADSEVAKGLKQRRKGSFQPAAGQGKKEVLGKGCECSVDAFCRSGLTRL